MCNKIKRFVVKLLFGFKYDIIVIGSANGYIEMKKDHYRISRNQRTLMQNLTVFGI